MKEESLDENEIPEATRPAARAFPAGSADRVEASLRLIRPTSEPIYGSRVPIIRLIEGASIPPAAQMP